VRTHEHIRTKRECARLLAVSRNCAPVFVTRSEHVMHTRFVVADLYLSRKCTIDAATCNRAPCDRYAVGAPHTCISPHEHIRTTRKCARLLAASCNCALCGHDTVGARLANVFRHENFRAERKVVRLMLATLHRATTMHSLHLTHTCTCFGTNTFAIRWISHDFYRHQGTVHFANVMLSVHMMFMCFGMNIPAVSSELCYLRTR